jgi:hypothetical protein
MQLASRAGGSSWADPWGPLQYGWEGLCHATVFITDAGLCPHSATSALSAHHTLVQMDSWLLIAP